MPTVRDLMTTDPITVDPDDSIETAISLMLKHGVSGLPVTDSSGRLLGVVSEFDLLELVWDPKSSKDKVNDYMSREIHTVDEDDELTAVAEQFRTRSFRRLPVMRGDQLVGVISRHDLLRDIMRARGQIAPVVPRLLSPINTHARTTVGI